jgi:carbon storage regulator
MLVLSRKTGERIDIGEDIQVVILGVSNGRVKLGFEAPRNVAVRRSEVERPGFEIEFAVAETGSGAY